MRQDKQDRRSLRTRCLVTSALMELLLEKRFDAITVQDMLDRAGIGRATFYAHFFDKDDVLESIVEEMLTTFRQQVALQDSERSRGAGDAGSLGQQLVPSLALFRHVQGQYPRFRALVRGHAGDVLWETGQVFLSRNIEQALVAGLADSRDSEPASHPSVPPTVVAQYLAGAFIMLFKWWLAAEMPYTPEEMDWIFRQLALPGIQSALRGQMDAPAQ